MGSYYDIEALLTDAHKVPCTFEIDIPGLGYLDENPGGDIKAHQNLSLPLWLATLLAVQRLPSTASSEQPRSLCTLDLPPSLHARVLNALKADPRTVDLRALSPQFYDLAGRILELFDEDEIVDVLTDTFQARAARIADLSAGNTLRGGRVGGGGGGAGKGDAAGGGGGGGGGGGIEGQEFLRGLDGMEEALFRGAHEGSRAVRTWLGETAGAGAGKKKYY